MGCRSVALLLMVFIMRASESNAADCPGCLELDELSFDQLLPRFSYALLKFDNAFPYGDKHEAFASLSRLVHEASSDILMGLVGIKNYGEFHNKRLAERFGVKSENYPVVILFRREAKDHIQFPADSNFTPDGLREFLKIHTDLYIGCSGCLRDFHNLAQHFADLSGDEQRKRLYQARQMSQTLTEERQKRSADIYIKYMQRFSSSVRAGAGDELEAEVNGIGEEIRRLKRIANGRISAEKKAEFAVKLGILEVFQSVGNGKEDL